MRNREKGPWRCKKSPRIRAYSPTPLLLAGIEPILSEAILTNDTESPTSPHLRCLLDVLPCTPTSVPRRCLDEPSTGSARAVRERTCIALQTYPGGPSRLILGWASMQLGLREARLLLPCVPHFYLNEKYKQLHPVLPQRRAAAFS